MASDILALLDTLDGLHGAATSAECWTGSWDSRPYARGGFPWATFAIGPQHGIPADPTTSDADRDAYDRGADARNADVAWVRAIVRDYPRLAAALRTALTPTTDGEREAREALAEFDARDRSHDIENDGAVCVSCHVSLRLRDECDWPDDGDVLCDGCTDRDRRAYVDHLRTTLALLATERAKAADAAREREAIVADLQAAADDLDLAMREPGTSSADTVYFRGARDALLGKIAHYKSGAHHKEPT